VVDPGRLDDALLRAGVEEDRRDTVPVGHSPNRLTIDQLAQETGLSVRNIRSHHARGLLPPPEVRHRVGFYGPEHIARLRLIQELQGEGFNLKGISRLIDDPHRPAERLLGVRRTLGGLDETEEPEVLTRADLAKRFPVGDDEGDTVLAKAQQLGIVAPLGADHYEVPSPSLLAAAETVVRHGISLTHAVDNVVELQRHSQAVARRFVKLFLDDVWKPFAEAGMPDEQWPAVLASIRQLRAAGAQAFLVVFRETLNRELDTALADLTKRLSEGKR
jgi:DNA-binding transcriptional MerR regulator